MGADNILQLLAGLPAQQSPPPSPPAPYGYRKNIKDEFSALEEFIIWLGGSQTAAG